MGLDGAGGLTAAPTCPFVSCAIPAWVQSISAGYGQDLFVVDAGGGIYKMNSNGLVTKIKDVSPTFVQPVIY